MNGPPVDDSRIEETVSSKGEVAEVLEPLLEQLELPPQKTDEVRRLVTTVMSFQGPIPPPDLLRHYEDIVPGSANRLIQLTEQQTGHRIEMESTVIKSKMMIAVRGRILAFVLSIFLDWSLWF